MLDYSHPTQNL